MELFLARTGSLLGSDVGVSMLVASSSNDKVRVRQLIMKHCGLTGIAVSVNHIGTADPNVKEGVLLTDGAALLTRRPRW